MHFRLANSTLVGAGDSPSTGMICARTERRLIEAQRPRLDSGEPTCAQEFIAAFMRPGLAA